MIKYILTFLIVCISAAIIFWSINRDRSSEPKEDEQFIHIEGFKSILDSSNLQGSILIYDPQKNSYYSNDFEWAKIGRLPASTYKIPHSIIALETGVVENQHSIFKWDGKKRFLDAWEKDLTFKEAFQLSCVNCYQEIAGKVGVERMREQLEKIQYGNMDVQTSNLSVFWLEGNSKISQFEQIDFLQRLHERKLGISEKSYEILRDIMIVEKSGDSVLRAKTGWAIRKGHNNGWFVGYLEEKEDVYFFATNVDPDTSFNMGLFPIIRKTVTERALSHMGYQE